jgi:hypothetical protein
MTLGIQLGMFRDEAFAPTASRFLSLQKEFPLQACEIHLEALLYKAA